MKIAPDAPAPKLSICISTLNRAEYLGAMLDSIISQGSGDVEIVVSDNASVDDTEQIVLERARHFDRLHYCRQEANEGVDRNYDRAVELARGEYCWLMADDDLLKPGSVQKVLTSLQQDFSLVLVNTEWVSGDAKTVVLPNGFRTSSDKIYQPDQLDDLFLEVGIGNLAYIGSYVIRRAIWLSRERRRYYNSWFIHMAIAFQATLPDRILLLAEPLIRYRRGNVHEWWSGASQIFLDRLPALIQLLPLSDSAKKKMLRNGPHKSTQMLILLRAWNGYALKDFHSVVRPRLDSFGESIVPFLIAVIPAAWVNRLYVAYLMATGQHLQLLPDLRASRCSARKA